MKSDAELVRFVLAGQTEQFAPLVRRYERAVRAQAYAVRADRDFVADAAQQTFLQAFAKLSTLHTPGAFGAWITKIARRCATDLARKRSQTLSLPDGADIVDEKRNGLLDEEKHRLLSALVKLPPAERQVLMLRYFEGHKMREIAAVTGRSLGTITKQLSRAHGRLRHLLAEPES